MPLSLADERQDGQRTMYRGMTAAAIATSVHRFHEGSSYCGTLILSLYSDLSALKDQPSAAWNSPFGVSDWATYLLAHPPTVALGK